MFVDLCICHQQNTETGQVQNHTCIMHSCMHLHTSAAANV